MHGPLNVKSPLVLNVLWTIRSAVLTVIFTEVFNNSIDINNNLYFADTYKILETILRDVFNGVLDTVASVMTTEK